MGKTVWARIWQCREKKQDRGVTVGSTLQGGGSTWDLEGLKQPRSRAPKGGPKISAGLKPPGMEKTRGGGGWGVQLNTAHLK